MSDFNALVTIKRKLVKEFRENITFFNNDHVEKLARMIGKSNER